MSTIIKLERLFRDLIDMPQSGEPRSSIEPLLPIPVTSEDEEDEPTAPLANMGLSLSTMRIVAPASYL